jgi:MFS family permease
VIRKFGSEASTVGGGLGLGIAVVGGVCMIVAGIVVDRMGKEGLSRALTLVAILQAFAIVLLGAALSVNNLVGSVILFSLLYGVMHFYVPVYYAVTNNHVPPALRATAVAVGVLAMTIIGSGLAPPIVGLLSDMFSKRFGAEGLAFAMAPASLSILFASIEYRRAARVLQGDVALSLSPA